LFAQFQPRNDAEAVAFSVGIALAGLVSGAIPFGYGLTAKQTGLGVLGGIISGVAGAALGCCGGIPVALLFCGIIGVVARASSIGRPPAREPRPADYDDYEHTENDFRRALPNLDRNPGPDHHGDPDEDRPRWRTYDDGERRRDERRDRDW
jgi:hypothetical protein